MSLNKTEHLLAVLAEECAEVIKEVNKLLRFGPDHENETDLNSEINDVLASIELINLHTDIRVGVSSKAMENKIKRVIKFMDGNISE